jgi:hypothetical protein
MYSLQGDVRIWYQFLEPSSISSLIELCVAFNLYCKRYYSSDFLFHDCCEEYEKSVQATLSFSYDCEVKEDNLVKEISEGSVLSSCCSYVLDADSNDSSNHKNTVDISLDYEDEINDKLVKKTREDSSLFFPSFSKLKADFVCFSYEENAKDIFVLETYVFSIPAYDEEFFSNTYQEQPFFYEYPSEDDEEYIFFITSLEPCSMNFVYDNYESDPCESHGGEKEELNVNLISCPTLINE